MRISLALAPVLLGTGGAASAQGPEVASALYLLDPEGNAIEIAQKVSG